MLQGQQLLLMGIMFIIVACHNNPPPSATRAEEMALYELRQLNEVINQFNQSYQHDRSSFSYFNQDIEQQINRLKRMSIADKDVNQLRWLEIKFLQKNKELNEALIHIESKKIDLIHQQLKALLATKKLLMNKINGLDASR